jgi:hypothetical protein
MFACFQEAAGNVPIILERFPGSLDQKQLTLVNNQRANARLGILIKNKVALGADQALLLVYKTRCKSAAAFGAKGVVHRA